MSSTLSKIGVVIAALALLLAGAVGGYVYSGIEGEQGPEGPEGSVGAKGDAGLQGPKGDKGDPGEDGINGTAGPPGSRGSRGKTGAPGINGTDGTNGTDGEVGPAGEDGADGADGADGIDLEPNEAPVISVNDSASYTEGMPCPGKYDDFRYKLNITTKDLEDDYRKITLYYRTDECCDWNYGDSWPYLNNLDYVTFNKKIDANWYWGFSTLYWLVECMDGENLVYEAGNTTLNKPICR